jgi:hypothetical protein
LSSDALKAMEERPYTFLAIAGGLAFAMGALWVVKRQQQQSRFQRLYGHAPSWSPYDWWRNARTPGWSHNNWWEEQMPNWLRDSWSKSAGNTDRTKLRSDRWF